MRDEGGAGEDRGLRDLLLIPNLLTLSRFLAAALVPLCFLATDRAAAEIAALSLFLYASVTDFADGYLARRLNQTSAIGAQLDTLADKALLTATLAALCLSQYSAAPWFWIGSGLIVARELGVTLLRRWRRGASGLKVTMAAKWKTTVQMVSVALLLGAGVVAGYAGPAVGNALETLGIALFGLAVWLTLSTGYAYLRAALAEG
ncbi:MAG: CDP-alcohol phosphatidyltransferase family protein [Pseudomonadota bacterium]